MTIIQRRPRRLRAEPGIGLRWPDLRNRLTHVIHGARTARGRACDRSLRIRRVGAAAGLGITVRIAAGLPPSLTRLGKRHGLPRCHAWNCACIPPPANPRQRRHCHAACRCTRHQRTLGLRLQADYDLEEAHRTLGKEIA